MQRFHYRAQDLRNLCSTCYLRPHVLKTGLCWGCLLGFEDDELLAEGLRLLALQDRADAIFAYRGAPAPTWESLEPYYQPRRSGRAPGEDPFLGWRLRRWGEE